MIYPVRWILMMFWVIPKQSSINYTMLIIIPWLFRNSARMDLHMSHGDLKHQRYRPTHPPEPWSYLRPSALPVFTAKGYDKRGSWGGHCSEWIQDPRHSQHDSP